MKKIILFATALLLSGLTFADEYVNDKYCVYRIDVGDQLAEVVNFYSESPSVTIPASFVYQGDNYIVVGITRFDFKEKYDSKYCYEDYKKNRASIVELILPQTIKYIGDNAFSDMTRLKNISIPSGVENTDKIFYENPLMFSWFWNNLRLENITFEGMLYYEKKREINEFPFVTRYKVSIAEFERPQSIIDSLKNALKEDIWKRCPKLQTIEVLPLKDFLLYTNMLEDTIAAYEKKLQVHPYYVEDKYFQNIKMVAQNGSDYKMDYDMQLSLCRDMFQKKWDTMEQNCKQKKPDLYADRYCANNPEFSVKIDNLLKDYKCKYTKRTLAIAVLNNHQLGEKCQDKLWREYSYLYKTKEDFLTDYNQSKDINAEISTRNDIYKEFKKIIELSDEPIKKLFDPTDYTFSGKANRAFYSKMKLYNIPIPSEIINFDSKAQKEFEKNGRYFDDLDEFFAAYITSEYKNILKEKKKVQK